MNNDNHKQTQSGKDEGQKAHLLDRYSVQPKADGGNEGKDSPFFKSAAPSISLPKGGGALKGIDEKFSVNALNGTAGMQIGLPITPGRAGFTPALSLNYNSGSGNSPFGLGWSLSLPSIQRKTDKKLPRYQDDIESDVFLLAGAEDLIPKLKDNGDEEEYFRSGTTYFIKRYIPRIEGLFARIEYIRKQNTPGGWWRVTTKDNITTYYGLTPEGRISEPEHPDKVFQWLPQLSIDHKGNIQLYRYKAEDLLNVEHRLHEQNRLNGKALFANTYLKRVQYCNRVPWFLEDEAVWEPELPVAASFLMEAVLDYGDHAEAWKAEDELDWPARADAFSDFHAGFEIRTYRRCKRVMMFHYFDELTFIDEGVAHHANLVRSLELEYKHGNPGSPLNEADMIVWAWQRGYDYQKRQGAWSWFDKTLPAMYFDYEPLHWDDTVHSVSEKDVTHAPQGLTGPYQWIDFEGEGISGILTEQNGGWFYKHNLGNGHFDTAKSIANKPSFAGLGEEMQWQDLEADGRRQVVSREVAKGYWELDDDQEWQPFRTFAKDLRINWNSPFTKMLDLDGDGRPDLLVTEDRAWTWYHNEGKNGFGTGGNAPVFTDEEKGPVLLLQDAVQSIFLADMNGDGLTDLVRIKNGEVCYWPNMGYGKFGAKVSMDNAPLFDTPDSYNPQYLTLADISGTGAADLIYLGKNNCTAWINLCGNGWSEAKHISPLPATNAYSKIAVLDFLGNGTGCLVWSSPLPQHAHAPMRYIDLMGGKKPYLMRRYDNGMGKTVRLSYKSSTQYYLEDKLSGYPWATRLPFPVHCINSVTTEDAVSETTYQQDYKYRHGYYDHEEREFRGFGYVETVDTDKAVWDTLTQGQEEIDITLNQPPVLTKTWNHTGAWMRHKVLTDAFKEEYFRFAEWDEQTLVVEIPHGLKAQELREANRALKGVPLRQEVYALDGTGKEAIPYTVTANAYTVKRVQPLGENRYASFISYKQQSVAFASERNTADPRVMQELILEVDQYGNVLKSAQVAYPRKLVDGTLPLKVREEQAKMHITFSENKFSADTPDNDKYYRLRLPYESKGYELRKYTYPAGLWLPSSLLTFTNTAPEADFSVVETTSPDKRLLSHSISRFLNDTATAGLPVGTIGYLGLPHQSYQKALTNTTLQHCYGSKVTTAMLAEGGFTDLNNDGAWWIPSGTATYQDPLLRFYTPVSFTDPWGVQTSVSFWGDYWLIPRQTTDARSNVATVMAYDWRILQPKEMKDANDNLSEMLYDTLGMPVAMAVKGKGSEGDSLFNAGLPSPDIYSFSDEAAQEHFFEQGDEASARGLLGNATWRCVYRLDSFPAAVGMIARDTHVADLGPGEETGLLYRFSYTDGLGRIIMHKVQCEPTQCNNYRSWIGTGRTVYNNKGNAVMQYEPYFAYNHLCEAAEDANDEGVSPKLYYDPLSRVYKTEMPDGSYSETVWTSWQQTVYDQNDTVLTSAWYNERINLPTTDPEYQAALKAAAHANTPSVMHTDSLARSFYTIQQDSQSSYIHSYVALDIQGNRLAVVDGKRINSGPAALTYRYNMLQQPCMQHSIDSGDGYTFTDVSGQPLYAWDADDRKFSMEYDTLRRLTGKRLNDAVLLEKTEYKDTIDGTGTAQNLRGQLYAHYDSSGKQSMPLGYDFKGNPAVVHQALLQDRTITDVDWDSIHTLETAYTSTSVQDALNRPWKMTDPGGNEHFYEYDKGGALKKVLMGSQEYVKDIRYDAKGQRKKIVYGNNTVTKYTYDPQTYRLRTLLTTANTGVDKRQELFYTYDPVGNIIQIRDGVQPNIYYNNTVVEAVQTFTYDALYRLIQAAGRELATAGPPGFGTEDNWNDAPAVPPPGSNAARNYTQTYTYDQVGNILSLQHSAGAGSYTRTFNYDVGHNRLLSTEVSAGAIHNFTNFPHDARGNMTDMPHLDYLHWNAVNELQELKKGSLQAYYQYSGGQRVRKWVDKGSVKEERIYLGGFEIYRKFDSSSLKIVERITVHISDDTGRIAMLENRTYGIAANDNNTLPALTRYIYSNHLQSASLELNENAEIISYEEYHPYGTSSYQAKSNTINAVAKRYRYTGKERDEESGLYYHGARYYIPWLCRWSASDPLESKYAGWSPYHYVKCNPVMDTDSTGMGGDDDLYGNVPKGVRNGGVAGAFTQGNPNAGSSSTPQASQRKGLQLNAIRLERKEYDLSYSWIYQPETFQNNVAASATNTVADAAEFVGNFFFSEGRSENNRRVSNLAIGLVEMEDAHAKSWMRGDAWDSFYKPILTSPQTYEDLVAGWGLGFAAEGAFSLVGKIPKLGFARQERPVFELPRMRGGDDLNRSASQLGASSASEGGTGRAFAGHGFYQFGSGTTIVPEGTSITMWIGEGQGISDPMGKLIEMGKYDEVLKNPSFVKKIETGAVTYLPGAEIPNYLLKPPGGLNVMKNSMIVEKTTYMQFLLKPNMGKIDWAACLKYPVK